MNRFTIVLSLVTLTLICYIGTTDGGQAQSSSAVQPPGLQHNITCMRCPQNCPSLQGWRLSCKNACKSYNTKLDTSRCESNRCMCRQRV